MKVIWSAVKARGRLQICFLSYSCSETMNRRGDPDESYLVGTDLEGVTRMKVFSRSTGLEGTR